MRVDPPTSRNSSISSILQVGVLQGPRTDLQGLFDLLLDQVLEFGPAQVFDQVHGAVLGFGDEGQVDLAFVDRRKLDLGVFRGLADALQRRLVPGKVDAVLVGEFLGQLLGQGDVEVVAPQVGVAGRGQHLDDAVLDVQDRDVDGAAAEVVDDDLGLFFQVDGIGQRRRRRFVDDALDVEPGDAAGVLGGLALGVVEIGRDGDDHAFDGVAQVAVGRVLELEQDHGGNLFR